jgi:hypothetical protein
METDLVNTAQKDDVIYFNMNVPNWFMDKPLEDKCKIVEKLAEKLKFEKPLTQEELDEFLPGG